MLPSYYESVTESHERYHPHEYPSNPRYFPETRFHEYYTVGDAEQFQEAIQENLLQQPLQHSETPRRIPEDSVWSTVQSAEKSPISDMFALSDSENVNQITAETYDYLAHTATRGAYIEIRGGKLVTILPFQNSDFYNPSREEILRREMGDNWQETVKSLIDETTPVRPGKTPQKVSLDPGRWRLNGPLIRYEEPPRHNVAKFHAFQNMFEELASTRTVPDCSFFLYNRDYPILRKDGKTPNEFWDSRRMKNFPGKFIPILGMTSAPGYADISTPNWDDWARVSALDSPRKFFRKSVEKEYELPEDIPDFANRRDVLVFRGGSTGAGVTPATNPRLAVVQYNNTRVYATKVVRPGETTPVELLNSENVLINVGITGLNRRIRKIPGQGLATIPADTPTGNSEFMSYAEQAENKYILNIDGHVSAFRLSMELASGSVVFLQENSPYSMWYKPYLVAYTHYVPVEYDLSNLTEQIQWCMSHQTECAQIAVNARQFYDRFLSKNGILDFWQTLLYRIVDVQGENRLITPIEAQVMSYATVARLKPTMNAITNTPALNLSKIYRTFPSESWSLQAGLDCTISTQSFSPVLPPKRRRVTVSKHRYSDDPTAIIVKQRRHEWFQTINENFIGRNIVNKLIEITPCFAWTMETPTPAENTVMLNVPGESFLGVILAGDYSLARRCVGMIGLALVTGQFLNGLCLNRLHPSDIILRRVEQKQVSFLTPDGVYAVSTDMIPTMVDYTHARGWTTDSVTSGLYGYASRYTPRFGLDMLCLAACTVKEFLEAADTPTPDLSGVKAVFKGFVDIPDLPNASKWARSTLRAIKRWIYAPYMDVTVDLAKILPGINNTTDFLLKQSLKAVDTVKIDRDFTFNTNGMPSAVVGVITRGVNGVKEQLNAINRCGFYVNSMLEKEYRKQLIKFSLQSLIETLRITPDADFASLLPGYERQTDMILRSCFIGQYLLGLRMLPSKRQLSNVDIIKSKVEAGPPYLDTFLLLQSLDRDSPLFSAVKEYLDDLPYREQTIATINAAKWLNYN